MFRVVSCEMSVHNATPGLDKRVGRGDVTEVFVQNLVLHVVVEDEHREDAVALDVSDRHLLASKVGLGILVLKTILELLAEVFELRAEGLFSLIIDGLTKDEGFLGAGVPQIFESVESPVRVVGFHRRATVQTSLAAEVAKDSVGLVQCLVTDLDKRQLVPFACSLGSSVLFESNTIVFEVNLRLVQS